MQYWRKGLEGPVSTGSIPASVAELRDVLDVIHVMAASRAWLGHMPWSMYLPEQGKIDEQEVTEQLLVGYLTLQHHPARANT